jgi:hypothetical protein
VERLFIISYSFTHDNGNCAELIVKSFHCFDGLPARTLENRSGSARARKNIFVIPR